MNAPFHFVTLHYRPSFKLGEVLTIGVLLWFEASQELVFVYPNQLERLKSLYFDVNLNSIKASLKAFERQALKLNDSHKAFLSHFDKNILADYFLVPDGNSFFFGEWGFGITNGRKIDNIVAYYKEAYLKYYFPKPNTDPRDEIYLKRQFQQAINAQIISRELVQEKYLVSGNRNVSHDFPYAWKNGTLNLITPISFDLEKAQSIQSKAARWFGLFSFLDKENKDGRLNFDILLAEPTNKDLVADYHDAKDILTDIPNLKYRFIEENEIEEYAKYVSKNAIPI